MARMASAITALENEKLPVYITPELKLMVSAVSEYLSFPYHLAMKLLLHPSLSNLIIDLVGPAGRILEPLIRNNVNATMVQGGEKINVIPSEIHLGLDGRLLPGFEPQDMLTKLQPVLGENVEIQVERYDPGPSETDMSLFPLLKKMIETADPDGIPIPFFLASVSDARFFSQLGIQTYGFIPMNLPPQFSFTELIHVADERIPIEALNFGTSVINNTLINYGGYVQ